MSETEENQTDISPNESASNLNGKRPRSSVWEHFTVCEDQPDKVRCSHCPKHKTYAYKNGGTTNLQKHLDSMHKFQLGKRDAKQRTLDDCSTAVVFSKQLFEEYLIDWILLNNQPFSEVDSEPLKRLLGLLKPVDIMSSTTLKRRIIDRFNSKLCEMRGIFEKLDSKVSFTTDCWTSPNNISFMGITAHYIDNDWTLQSVTLDFLPLSDPHTGLNLSIAFSSVLEKFSLTEKVMGITLDNASNNDSFINLDLDNSFQKYHHIRCFAHVLNLGAQAALTVISPDLEKLRIGIRKIRCRPQSFQKFKKSVI